MKHPIVRKTLAVGGSTPGVAPAMVGIPSKLAPVIPIINVTLPAYLPNFLIKIYLTHLRGDYQTKTQNAKHDHQV